MQITWKRFEAWVIGLRNNLFFTTRLRLTAIYIVIIAVILFIFSQIIYVMIGRDIRRAAARYAVTDEQEMYFVEAAEGQLFTTLMLVNGGILLITGALSYFLAGKTLSPIKQTFDAQRQFLSDASHELRTPLAVLKTTMEVSLEEKNKRSADEIKNLKNNLEEVDHMTNLVNNLLLLSRLDNTKQKSVEYIALLPILETAVERMKKYALMKKITIDFVSPKGKQFSVDGNAEGLLSAFSNILKNAVDYNEERGSVSVSLQRTDGYIRILIDDTGVGIPKEQLPFVFQRFYRGEKSRTGRVNGTGLGLSIAQAIIRDHGGTIELESKVGKGTHVAIVLPFSAGS